jgi:hypothetical protein
MQRMAWTDERLEERFDGIDLRFDGIDRRFDETDRRLTELDRKLDWRFVETDRRLGNVEAGMKDLQNLLSRVGSGIIVSLFGVIAAILVKGG